MNKERRKTIDSIMADVEKLTSALSDLREAFSDIATAIEEVRDEEQEAFDALPESLQDGDRGQSMQNAIGELETALEMANEIGDINAECDAIIQALDEAKAQ